MMVLGLLAATAFSQPTLEECSQIGAAMERLACYDQLVGRVETVPVATNTHPVLEAPKSEEQLREEFEERTRLAKAGKTPSIVSDITEIIIDKNDRLTLILENGQVWRQLSSDRPFRVNSKNPPKQVTITEAALDSYRLKLDDARQSLRVRRVK